MEQFNLQLLILKLPGWLQVSHLKIRNTWTEADARAFRVRIVLHVRSHDFKREICIYRHFTVVHHFDLTNDFFTHFYSTKIETFLTTFVEVK